jgi:hypothetical protein
MAVRARPSRATLPPGRYDLCHPSRYDLYRSECLVHPATSATGEMGIYVNPGGAAGKVPSAGTLPVWQICLGQWRYNRRWRRGRAKEGRAGISQGSCRSTLAPVLAGLPGRIGLPRRNRSRRLAAVQTRRRYGPRGPAGPHPPEIIRISFRSQSVIAADIVATSRQTGKR